MGRYSPLEEVVVAAGPEPMANPKEPGVGRILRFFHFYIKNKKIQKYILFL